MTHISPSPDPSTTQPRSPHKTPRLVFEEHSHAADYTLFAFPPNRHTLGGTAYFIVNRSLDAHGRSPNILIDCPAWTEEHQAFITQQGGVQTLAMTHRGAIAQVKEIQAQTGCDVVIQEQEAYLLPNLAVKAFHKEIRLGDHTYAFWTPGHSPGSTCVYDDRHGGVLFPGRHLLPNAQGQLEPLRLSKTFHWPRQLRSVQQIRDRFTADTLSYICPGASTGFLRGKRAIAHAYTELMALDLDAYRQKTPLI